MSGLPIEYYDSRVLKHIGNKIGNTVKVDKNNVMQERGKYARIRVEVDLTNDLLEMFMIKGQKYNVEYGGLHLLYTNCGKFGHYSERCPNKAKAIAEKQKEVSDMGEKNKTGGGEMIGSGSTRPWVVVHKQRKSRKGKEKEGTVVVGGGRKGPTRFNVRDTNNCS